MDREAFKNLLASKRGGQISEEEVKLVDGMNLRELAKIFELVQSEKDWESEIKKLKEKRNEEKEKKRKEEEAKRAEEDAKKKEEDDKKKEADDKKKAAEEEERKKKEEEERKRKEEEEPEIDEAELEAMALAEAEAEALAELERQEEEERKKKEEEDRKAAEKAAEDAANAAAEAEMDEDELEALALAEAEAEALAELEREQEEAAAAAKQKKKREKKVRVLRDEFGKFILPPTFQELECDPRTEVDLVDIPANCQSAKVALGEHPILHFCSEVLKCNSNKKYDKRVCAVSNYCIFLMHADGKMARGLEIADIEKVFVGGDTIAFRAPKEFDLMVKLQDEDQLEEILEAVQSVYTYKKKVPLDVEDLGPNSENTISQQLNLVKPKYWKPEDKHVHSKEELYQRLEAMNRDDDALAYLNMKTDPRTGCVLIEIPKESKHIFATGPFKSDPLLHSFQSCIKVNSRGANDIRFCLITNSCLYLTYPNGNLQRCINVHKASELHLSDTAIALVLPEDFDILLKFNTVEAAREVEGVIKAIYEYKNKKAIAVVEGEPSKTKLNLNKPKGWQARFAPVLQRKDLVDYLQNYGIRPDMTKEQVEQKLKEAEEKQETEEKAEAV